MKKILYLSIVILLIGIPYFAQAQVESSPQVPAENSSGLSVELSVPIGGEETITGSTGQDILVKYVGTVYTWAATIVGIIAVFILIISGIQITAAAGDEQAVSKAKTRIFQSLGGLIVLLVSGVILYLVNPNFFTR